MHWPPRQSWPHAPQLATSFMRSTQPLGQAVSMPAQLALDVLIVEALVVEDVLAAPSPPLPALPSGAGRGQPASAPAAMNQVTAMVRLEARIGSKPPFPP